MQLTEGAQKVLDEVNKGEHPNEMDGKLGELVASWSCSDGFWYGLSDGGYIDPKAIVDEGSATKIAEAVKVLKDFEEIWQEISIEF